MIFFRTKPTIPVHRVLNTIGVFLTLAVIIAILAFLTSISLAVEGKTITVDQSGGGDSTSIQGGLSLAGEGDEIIVSQGTYAENFDVDKKVTISGAGNDSTFIVGSGTGSTILVSVSGVELSGFHISGGGSGLRDGGISILSNGNTISNMNCSSNKYGGIVVSQSEGNTIRGVTTRSNGKSGIEIFESSHTTVMDSTIFGNPTGVNCAFSPGSTLEGLFIRQSTEGIRLYRSSDTTVDRSTVRGNGFGLFSQDCNGLVIEQTEFLGNTFALVIQESEENHIRNVHAHHNTNGIILWKSNVTQIEDCNISQNSQGIRIDRSGHNLIKNCTFFKNSLAIRVEDNSKRNLVLNTHFSENSEAINATGREGFPIDAMSNYWGNASGPYHHTNNTNGTGDPVSDLVKFSPWLQNYPPEPEPEENEIPLFDILSFVLILLILLLAVIINYGDRNHGNT